MVLRTGYAKRIGDGLRHVREQQGLSLHDVERMSNGELKASVVGAYERADRQLSVARLAALAAFYKVPVQMLLPEDAAGPSQEASATHLRIDLTRIDQVSESERVVVKRFIDAICASRGDYNGRVLTLRQRDATTLGAMLNVDIDDLPERLAPAASTAENA